MSRSHLAAGLVTTILLGVISGCGGGASGSRTAAASTKKCLERHGITVDSSGRKFPLSMPAAAVSQLHLLEFEIPVQGTPQTDKVGLLFYGDREKASAALKQIEAQEALIVARQPASQRAQLRRLLKGSYEQRQSAVISWANFGGTSASRRLVASCLSD